MCFSATTESEEKQTLQYDAEEEHAPAEEPKSEPLEIGTQHAALPAFAETPEGANDVKELEKDEDDVKQEEQIIASTPAGPALEVAEKKEEADEVKEKDDEGIAEHDFAASPEGETPAAKAEEATVVSDEHKEDAEVEAEETETKTEDKPGLAPAAEAADENKDKEEEEEGAVEEDKTLDAEEKAFGKTAAEEKEEQEAAKEEKTPETPAQEEAEHKGEDEYVKKGPCTAIAQVSGAPKSGSWKVTDEKSLATREQARLRQRHLRACVRFAIATACVAGNAMSVVGGAVGGRAEEFHGRVGHLRVGRRLHQGPWVQHGGVRRHSGRIRLQHCMHPCRCCGGPQLRRNARGCKGRQ